jgi:hypothetical protein
VGNDLRNRQKYFAPFGLRRLPETAVAAHRGIADQEIQSKTSQDARIEQTVVVAVHWILTSETSAATAGEQERDKLAAISLPCQNVGGHPTSGYTANKALSDFALCVKSNREGDRWPLNGKTSSNMASQEMFNPCALIFHSLPPFSFKLLVRYKLPTGRGATKSLPLIHLNLLASKP